MHDASQHQAAQAIPSADADDDSGQPLSGFADAIAYMARSGGGIRRYVGMPERLVTLACMATQQFPRAIFTPGCLRFLEAAEGAHINTLDTAARRLFDEGDLSPDQRAEVRLAMDDLNHLRASAEAHKALAKAFFEFAYLMQNVPGDEAAKLLEISRTAHLE